MYSNCTRLGSRYPKPNGLLSEASPGIFALYWSNCLVIASGAGVCCLSANADALSWTYSASSPSDSLLAMCRTCEAVTFCIEEMTWAYCRTAISFA